MNNIFPYSQGNWPYGGPNNPYQSSLSVSPTCQAMQQPHYSAPIVSQQQYYKDLTAMYHAMKEA